MSFQSLNRVVSSLWRRARFTRYNLGGGTYALIQPEKRQAWFSALTHDFPLTVETIPEGLQSIECILSPRHLEVATRLLKTHEAVHRRIIVATHEKIERIESSANYEVLREAFMSQRDANRITQSALRMLDRHVRDFVGWSLIEELGFVMYERLDALKPASEFLGKVADCYREIYSLAGRQTTRRRRQYAHDLGVMRIKCGVNASPIDLDREKSNALQQFGIKFAQLF